VKYSLRTMRRTPGFTTIAVLMLAIGTGANVAMFSVIDAVLIRSPFARPDRLVMVSALVDNRPTLGVPVDRLPALTALPQPLAAVSVFGLGAHVLTGAGDPRDFSAECVSAGMFEVLQTRPLIGRGFDAADDQPGAAPTVVLSYNFWRELGGSPSIVGSTLTVNAVPVTVVGVMPRGFNGPMTRASTQGWVPYRRPIVGGGNTGCRQGRTVNVFARIADGVGLQEASGAVAGFTLQPLDPPIMEGVRTPFRILSMAVACVLLIACLNVGGLQLERALARRREMALRIALGANRGRLIRQTLTENLLLGLAGGIAGAVTAALTLNILVSILPASLPHLADIEINARVLLAALAAGASAGLIAALMPIVQTRGFAPARDLAEGARGTGRSATWLRAGLVVLEITLSVVVLIGAGLMVQTLMTLRPDRPGFDASGKSYVLLQLRGAPPADSLRFFRDFFDALRRSPAVRDAAGTTYLPMSGVTGISMMRIGEKTATVFTNAVTPNYLNLLRVPIVDGRGLADSDTAASPPVIVVNENLAKRLQATGNVVGQPLSLRLDTAGPADPFETRTIVGVAADMRNNGGDTRSRSEAYVPHAQAPSSGLLVVFEPVGGRDVEAIAALRSTVRTMRPGLVVNAPKPLTAILEESVSYTRFGAWLLGLFGTMAVALASVGLMTTIGWWVAQRTREMGIRLALGATTGRIASLVLRQGLTLAVCGIGAGCAAAAGLTRFMQQWIYQVAPIDAKTFIVSALAMLAVSFVAICLPMRRAARVDPVTALRME
jgi:predicted permease